MGGTLRDIGNTVLLNIGPSLCGLGDRIWRNQKHGGGVRPQLQFHNKHELRFENAQHVTRKLSFHDSRGSWCSCSHHLQVRTWPRCGQVLTSLEDLAALRPGPPRSRGPGRNAARSSQERNPTFWDVFAYGVFRVCSPGGHFLAHHGAFGSVVNY